MNHADYEAADKLLRRHKALLARAHKSGDPHRVIAACTQFVKDYEYAGYPWPDQWHTWNIAYSDATYALTRRFHHLDELRDQVLRGAA